MNRKSLTDDTEGGLQALRNLEDLQDLKDAQEAKEEAKREGTATLSDFKKEFGL